MSETTIVLRQPGSLNEVERCHMSRLISAVSDEFIPPLLRRSSTSQQNLSPNSSGKDSTSYVAELFGQSSLIAIDGRGQVIGLLSFRIGHRALGSES